MCFCNVLTGMIEPEDQAPQNIYPDLNPSSADFAVQPMDILEVGIWCVYMVDNHIYTYIDAFA